MSNRLSVIRGGLKPNAGTVGAPVTPKLHKISKAGKLRQGPAVIASPNNRIPPSMSLKKNLGTRGH